MYGHEVDVKIKDGKETYNISLYSRWYFFKKKLNDVVYDIPEKEDALKLCSMLDSSFKAGMILAKGVK